MTVTLDFAALEQGTASCLPQGRTRQNSEVASGRDVRVIPGNTMSLTLRVTAGEPLDVKDISSTGTIETKLVHGFAVGDAIHMCFYSGLSSQQITPYILVKEVIDDHHFTISDATTPPVQVILKKENDSTLTADKQPEVCGWVAKAANLKGFSAAIVIDLDTGRRDELLGTASIRKGEKQLSIKGSWDIRKDDELTIGSFTSCASMVRKVNMPDGCYTIVQLCKAAPEDIKFTDGRLASLSPFEPLIQGVGYGDAWGWVNVTLPGSKTWVLADYKKHTVNNCPQFVGEFRYELRGFTLEYPEWFTGITCGSESTFTRVVDWGRIWI
jgi:hypothetical protein